MIIGLSYPLEEMLLATLMLYPRYNTKSSTSSDLHISDYSYHVRYGKSQHHVCVHSGRLRQTLSLNLLCRKTVRDVTSPTTTILLTSILGSIDGYPTYPDSTNYPSPTSRFFIKNTSQQHIYNEYPFAIY